MLDSIVSSAANIGLGIGGAFLSDWFGDQNAERDQALDFSSYQNKSALDWYNYRNNYAPYNQQLQKEMFDYTSAGNLANSLSYFDYTSDKNLEQNKAYYDYTYQKQLDSIADKKRALIAAGYNPILAVNGGLSVLGSSAGVGGATIGSSGQIGATGSPHSAQGFSHGSDKPNVDLGRLSLGELVALRSSAAQIAKTEAETSQIQARTDAVRATSELDRVKAGAELRSLIKELSPGDDVSPLDESGLRKLEKVFENKLDRDAYLNSIERQVILDSVGVGSDVAHSASSLKSAFNPARRK